MISGKNVGFLPHFKISSKVQNVLARISSQPSHAGRGVDPPWLVWIDDNPNNINGQIAFAEYMGVTVFILTSTASAKVWIDANEGRLWQLSSCRHTI